MLPRSDGVRGPIGFAGVGFAGAGFVAGETVRPSALAVRRRVVAGVPLAAGLAENACASASGRVVGGTALDEVRRVAPSV